MSKQSDRVPGTVTDAEIQKLCVCEIAKIPEAARTNFADDFRAVIAKATRRGKDYKSPDGAAPIIADAEAASAAAIKLFNAIEKCGAETRSLMQRMLLEGTVDETKLAVHDLFTASDLIVDALNNANGKPRNTKGRPSTEVGNPGFQLAICSHLRFFVRKACGRRSPSTRRTALGAGAPCHFSTLVGRCFPLPCRSTEAVADSTDTAALALWFHCE